MVIHFGRNRHDNVKAFGPPLSGVIGSTHQGDCFLSGCEMRGRYWVSRTLVVATLGLFFNPTLGMRSIDAQDVYAPTSVITDTCLDGCVESTTSRSSCCCNPPGTLFQWSYGTSFSGGPNLNEPLVTDRPDFTEASSTVGRRVAQLEIGYTYTFDQDDAATKSHSFPEPLLRYGILAEWLELRVGWNYAQEASEGISTEGGEDLYLGFKIGLTPQEGILPEMALIPQMTVPTGDEAFSAGQVQAGLNWIYGWEINDWLSTAGSTQFNRASDEVSSHDFTEWAQSWTFGYTLSERIGAYTEWYALFPHSADSAVPEHYFNGGFTYLVTNDIQWDIRAGMGLNSAADDYFVGTGMSIRFR